MDREVKNPELSIQDQIKRLVKYQKLIKKVDNLEFKVITLRADVNDVQANNLERDTLHSEPPIVDLENRINSLETKILNLESKIFNLEVKLDV